VFYRTAKIPKLDGNLFFATLRDEALYRIVLSGPRTVSRIERWFSSGVHEGKLGRLRAVVEGPDGALYISTSNRDRRGTPLTNDDHIYRLTAK
jgi:glucose/arabinose dehydrogenase